MVWEPGRRAPQAALCSLASPGPKIWLPRFLLGGKPQSLPNFRRKELSERDLARKGECRWASAWLGVAADARKAEAASRDVQKLTRTGCGD